MDVVNDENYYNSGSQIQTIDDLECNKSHQLYESVQQFMIKNSKIITKLQQLLSQINQHKNGCNIAKTVGTSVSGVGSVAMATGLVLTPFTAGISSLVVIGGGVATAVGTVTNIGTDLADKLISKNFLNEIKSLAEERNKCLFDLTKRFGEFNAIMSQNIKRKLNQNLMDDNCEYVLDFINIMKLLANGSINIYKFGNKSIKLFDAVKEMKAISATRAVKTSSDLGTSIGKSVITLIPAESKGVSSLIRSTGPAVGKNVFKGVSAVAGLAFTVLDVVSLVQDWKKCHPSIDVINNLIEELKSDAKLVESIYSIITINDCDQQLINEIISFVESNSNYLDNEPEVNLDFDNCRVSYINNATLES